jgi:hypothetical protein
MVHYVLPPEPKPPDLTPPIIDNIINHLAEELTYTPTHPAVHQLRLTEPSYNQFNNELELPGHMPHLHNHKNQVIHPTYNEPINIIYQDLPSPCTYNTPTIHRLMHAAWVHSIRPNQVYQIQQNLHIDGGANRFITGNKDLLISYTNIPRFFMSSASTENEICCTGRGYLPWRAPCGTTILVKCYYSEQAVDTIISLTDIVVNLTSNYTGWTQHADVTTATGSITFHNKHTGNEVTFPTFQQNGLWYYNNTDYLDYTGDVDNHYAIIKRVSARGIYNLIHARLGHPGDKVM